MKTKHARAIREAIMKARHKNGPDWLWATVVATKFQWNVFNQEIFRMHRRDLLREYKKR